VYFWVYLGVYLEAVLRKLAGYGAQVHLHTVPNILKMMFGSWLEVVLRCIAGCNRLESVLTSMLPGRAADDLKVPL
jgi:hypothetical protein